MPSFAANLSTMFNEWSFLDRFSAAADAGFTAVECVFPYEATAVKIAAKLQSNNLHQVLFNMPGGDWDAGERGFAAMPSKKAEFKASVELGLEYAVALGVKRLHMMAGLADPADPSAVSCYRDSIAYASELLAEAEIDLLIEPLNLRDRPGYFLSDFGFAEDLIRELKLPNLKLQFDIYHRQISHGDVVMSFRSLLPLIGHVQIASVPSRQEPDREELNYDYLFEEIDRAGYDGYVGCEYFPRAGTLEGLSWFAPYRSNT